MPYKDGISEKLFAVDHESQARELSTTLKWC